MDIIVSIISILVSAFLGWWLSPYLQQKGKNLATKEDIAKITEKKLIELDKRRLKYDACLESLSIIDAVFSQVSWKDLKDGKSIPVTKQKIDIEKARGCHNKLILSCENIEVINKFTEILSNKKSGNETKLLNEYRNLIREELNFGKNRILDENLAWIRALPGDGTLI